MSPQTSLDSSSELLGWLLLGMLWLLLGLVYSTLQDRRVSDFRGNNFYRGWIGMLTNFFEVRQDHSRVRFFVFFIPMWLLWPIAPVVLLLLWGMCRKLKIRNF